MKLLGNMISYSLDWQQLKNVTANAGKMWNKRKCKLGAATSESILANPSGVKMYI